jgi:hypothetical protein
MFQTRRVLQKAFSILVAFGRLFSGGGGRATRFAKAVSIAGAKTVIDAVLNRNRASIYFERLGDSRYYVYLLFALDHRFFAPYFAHPEFYRMGLHREVPGNAEQGTYH